MANWQDAFSRAQKMRRTPLTKRVTIEELRAWFAEALPRYGQMPRHVTTAPAEMGPVRGEWVDAGDGKAQRTILYLHGGGFVWGSPATHRPLIARLAEAAEARALSVHYRLAPEVPCPAALRDALDAYRWLLAQGHPPQSLAIAGDCAGGGIALALLMAIRNADIPPPACLVAMSPWTDLSLGGWSMLENAENDGQLSWTALVQCARHYLGTTSPADAFASPLYGDFKGLPPLMIHAGAQEVLRDDASRVGDRAAAAGVRVSVEVYDQQPHLFQLLGTKEAKVSMSRLGTFVKQHTTAALRRRQAG